MGDSGPADGGPSPSGPVPRGPAARSDPSAGAPAPALRLLSRRAPASAADLLAPVAVTSVADEVADRLVTAIALGEFLPGERLPAERDLARTLGVGRGTVRRALSRLVEAGAVEVRRGRSGTVVRADWIAGSAAAVRRTLLPQWSELEQLVDLRGLVEAMVARTAAERRDAGDVTALRAALARFAGARTPRQEHTADIALHEAVVTAAHNPYLAELTTDLLARVALGFPIEPYTPEVYARALREHGELVGAVVAERVEAAGTVALHHFGISADVLRATLQRGLGDDAVPGSRSG